MKIMMAGLSLAGLLAAAAGCSGPMSGVAMAGAQEVTVGARAPDVSFNTSDGQATTLHKYRLPVAVVAFVAPEGPCTQLAPQLVDLSGRFARLPVSVVQISQPTPACAHGPGCVLVTGPGKRDVLAICDPGKKAWRSFKEPPLGSVFLIDENNKVVETGTLENLAALRERAIGLGQAAAARHEGT